MELVIGTFEKECGVIVEYNGKLYHKIVFEDENGCFVEFEGKKFYKNEIKCK